LAVGKKSKVKSRRLKVIGCQFLICLKIPEKGAETTPLRIPLQQPTTDDQQPFLGMVQFLHLLLICNQEPETKNQQRGIRWQN